MPLHCVISQKNIIKIVIWNSFSLRFDLKMRKTKKKQFYVHVRVSFLLCCSDYGYNRTTEDKCERMKHYSLAEECPPGAKYFNRTRSGFRLIPGDQCRPSKESQRLLASEQLACIGHEEDSGFDNSQEAIHRAVSLVVRNFNNGAKNWQWF